MFCSSYDVVPFCFRQLAMQVAPSSFRASFGSSSLSGGRPGVALTGAALKLAPIAPALRRLVSNAVHGSRSFEAAAREVSMLFGAPEVDGLEDGVLGNMRRKLCAPSVPRVGDTLMAPRKYVRGGGERGGGSAPLGTTPCAGARALSVGGLNETTCIICLPTLAGETEADGYEAPHTGALAFALEEFAKAGFVIVAQRHVVFEAESARQFVGIRVADLKSSARHGAASTDKKSHAELAGRLCGHPEGGNSGTVPICVALAMQRDNAVTRANSLLGGGLASAASGSDAERWTEHIVASCTSQGARKELCFLFDKLYNSVDDICAETETQTEQR